MPNTYTIEGLTVPELSARITAVQEDLSSLRLLFTEAVEAITRLNDDVQMLAEAFDRT